MREYYEILGLEQTYDLKIVKRGYANRVKVFNPEKNPEEFEKIRNAYDEIIKYIKNNEKEVGKSKILTEKQKNNSESINQKYIIKFSEFFHAEEYDKLIYLYEKHIEENEDLLKNNEKVGILCMVGIAYMEKNKISLAISKFEKGIKFNNTSYILHYNIANAYKRIKDYKKASINYEKAFELNNRNENYKNNIFESNILGHNTNELYANMKKYKLSEEEKLHYFILCLNQYINTYENRDVGQKNISYINEILNIISEEYKNSNYKTNMHEELLEIINELDKPQYDNLKKIISATTENLIDKDIKIDSSKNKKRNVFFNIFKV